MTDFTTSQLSPDGNRIGNKNKQSSSIRNNTLVVVVTKAHGLRNVLKMDKQSPFITIRIQDQEESTKVVARGGQTPTFNNELWFNLDGIEERTLYINAYHQKKNDAKLICSGEVDFSTALKRSTIEGYDGWFDLYYQGREAGRIYLEMTYYPKKGDVPIGTESVGRIKMSKSSTQLPLSALTHTNDNNSFNNTLREKNRMYKKSDADDIPELGELKINEMTTSSRGKINNKFSNFENRFHNNNNNNNNTRSTSHSPTKSDSSMELFNDNLSDSPASSILDNNIEQQAQSNSNGGWLSFLDTPIKFSLFNGITFNGNNNNNNQNSLDSFNSNNNKLDKGKGYDINDAIEHKVKLKVESPNLFKERPKKLFDSDDENDEEEIEDKSNSNNSPNKFKDISINGTDAWKKSIASRQEPIYKERGLTISSLPFKRNDIIDTDTEEEEDDDDDDDGVEEDSDDEYTIGQVVDFKESVKSKNTISMNEKSMKLSEKEMRNSYRGRKLPPLNVKESDKQNTKAVIPTLSDSSSEELDMDELDNNLPPPPPPPKHIISMNSLFESSVSTSSSPIEKFVLHQTPSSELLPTSPKAFSNESTSNMSWYNRRKMEKRRQYRTVN
ncbi:hypothetical protein C6P40_004465 [Pichia californica]|uniref:C2 domain-containing protein n=1 Tax=Pichia californica TaxID=460514 RepID=A0A9P7BGA8_9ASCO|nr:hypothetical protein C6P42_000662 [[Candida] californica]KAG0689806.1 hypothetical protein C6P40_004465 [[Candida] californica]